MVAFVVSRTQIGQKLIAMAHADGHGGVVGLALALRVRMYGHVTERDVLVRLVKNACHTKRRGLCGQRTVQLFLILTCGDGQIKRAQQNLTAYLR